ncbi:PTS IIA-like nitrogen regulatory protein PtsN [Umboniibacter marinipuniceus]|uniref:Phosphotransferase IIA-like nitrogen-regulatory protein PtsN n=1 Tax=Umboniibacter marinipuniceus TaxID=569599 RepID=A0A3M0A480_9GAMM|nr:PTS IIA-like nitrogen regulatory protein PtsN [Umboniibacter marinipuniceus]RMA79447.1 phosphotransferase IIA-like nitrogen-regulatory protein PtsN [Umboniibacter marinipuniceus]
MELAQLLTPDTTRASARVGSKKTCLELIAEIVSESMGIHDTELFKALFERERLGSTGLGNGIAIPHCRIPGCPEVIGVLLTLENPIDFDAHDGQPVDVVCALIVPQEATEDHLQALSAIAERFNDSRFIEQLRQSTSASELYELVG